MADAISGLPPAALRWRCAEGEFRFETTAELPDYDDVLGQERAQDALRFGARITSPTHHIYAMGDPATDRLSVVLQSLERETRGRPAPQDWCYLNSFADPRRPRVLVLPRGRGTELKRDMNALVDEISAALPAAFESDSYRASRVSIDHEFEEREQKFLAGLQEEAEKHKLGVIRTPHGFAIAPLRDGTVVEPDEFKKLPEAQRREMVAHIERLTELLHKHIERLPTWVSERHKRVRELDRQVTELAILGLVRELKSKYLDHAEVLQYFAEVERDLIENAQIFRQEERLPGIPGLEATVRALGARRYEVNVLVDNSTSSGPPVVYEASPTYQNLLGRVEHATQFGTLTTDFTMTVRVQCTVRMAVSS